MLVYFWCVYHSSAETLPHRFSLKIGDHRTTSITGEDTDSESCDAEEDQMRKVGAIALRLGDGNSMEQMLAEGPGSERGWLGRHKKFIHGVKPIDMWWEYMAVCKALRRRALAMG